MMGELKSKNFLKKVYDSLDIENEISFEIWKGNIMEQMKGSFYKALIEKCKGLGDYNG